MLTHFFEILKKRLTDEVPPLREVEWYMNQDSVKDKNADIKAAPAAFIEVLPFQTRDLKHRIQQATIDFDVLLITETLHDEGSKRMKTDQPADHMALFEKINDVLGGFSARLSYLPAFEDLEDDEDVRVCNTITRISIQPPHKYLKALMRSRQRFRCVVWDHSSRIASAAPPTEPVLETTVEMAGPYVPVVPTIPMPTDMILWFDAQDESTIDLEDGDRVIEWRDKSAFANHVTAAMGSDGRPQLVLEAFGDKSVLSFDGSVQGLSGTVDQLLNKQKISAFFVGNGVLFSSGVAFGSFHGAFTIATRVSLGSFMDISTSKVSTVEGLNDDFSYDKILYDGTQAAANRVKIFANRVEQILSATSDIAPNTPNNSNTFTIANGIDQSPSYAECSIAEIIVFDRQLTADEIMAVEQYIADKYSL